MMRESECAHVEKDFYCRECAKQSGDITERLLAYHLGNREAVAPWLIGEFYNQIYSLTEERNQLKARVEELGKVVVKQAIELAKRC